MTERRFKAKKKPVNWKPRTRSSARKGLCCGAFSRRTGRECRNAPEWPSKRCRQHGSRAGSKSDYGRQVSSEMRKAEWRAWRASVGLPKSFRYSDSRGKGGRITSAQWLAEHGPCRPEGERP